MAIIHPMRHLQRLREAQVVIEGSRRMRSAKRALFAQLGQVCEPSTLLASNTSSISIASLGMASGRPDRVLGLHFMNPVPVMRLVEVVRAIGHLRAGHAPRIELIRRAGKTPVVCKDFPGFIVNRVLIPMINEAIFALEDGVATAEEIDLAMVEGTHHPVGPLALADRIGRVTVLAI